MNSKINPNQTKKVDDKQLSCQPLQPYEKTATLGCRKWGIAFNKSDLTLLFEIMISKKNHA